jgi:soluble cytochrome b562
MKLINRSVKRLKQQIADSEKKEDNLKLVGDVERAIVAAKGMPLPERREPGAGEGARGREQPGGRLENDQNEAPAPKSTQPKDGDAKGQPGREPLTPEQKAKAAESYRRELMKLMRQMLDIEQDLLDGNLDQAKTEVAKVTQTRDEAHKALGVRQERDRD